MHKVAKVLEMTPMQVYEVASFYTMFNRTKQHGWTQPESAIRKHFDQCHSWKEIVGVFQMDGLEIDRMKFQVNCVRENTEIINRSDNWLKLSFLESLAI